MHTKEPWRVEVEEYNEDLDYQPFVWPCIYAGDTEIVGTEGFYGDSLEQSIADANRAALCVNACSNIPDYILERIVSGELVFSTDAS